MKPMRNILAVIGLLLCAAPWHLAHGADGEAEEERVFSQAEIEQMLAPIALYPDTVLSHLLIAATYPLEVVQAERWTQRHPDLKGAEAVAAADDQDWDPSVKALVAFPQILERMSEDLDWTQNLGDAFLLDEERMLLGIQELRQRAYAEGNLKTTDYVEVVREPDTIIVESRTRDVVYIPYYDTRVVYGTWHWPGYHPVYWHRPANYYWHSGFYWGPGIRLDHSFYFSSFHWGQRRTVVVHGHRHQPPPRFTSGYHIARHERARHWRHDPYHRRGVEYRQVRVHRNEGAPARIERRRSIQDNAIRSARPQAGDTRERLRSTAPRADQRAPSRVSPERAQRQEHSRATRTNPSAAETRQRLERSNRAEPGRAQPSQPTQSVRQQRSQPRSSPPAAAPQRQQAPQRSQRPARQSMQHSPSSRQESATRAAPRSAPASRSAGQRQSPRRSRE